MALISVLAESIRPERLGAFEENVRKLAQAAVEKREALRWTAHQTAVGEIGTIDFVAQMQDWSELEARGTPGEMARRVLGEKEAARFQEEVRSCVIAARQTVARDRPELSYPPEPGGAPAPYHVVTQVRVRPGAQDAFEEFLRKIAEAIPKVNDPARTLALQTLVGNLREYTVVRPLRALKDLDAQLQPQDLMVKAFGSAEGNLLARTGLEAIEHVERRIVAYRQDLSNPPG
jgi:hypothetical protein